MEHRWGRRKAAELDVRLRGSPGAIGFGSLRDVSLSGAYVRTSLFLPLLGCVTVSVGNDEVPAQVVRRDGKGLGLEWEEFAPRVIGRLLGYSSATLDAAAHQESSVHSTTPAIVIAAKAAPAMNVAAGLTLSQR